MLTTNDAPPDRPTPLPVLQAGGFSASVDAWAGESDPDPTAQRTRLWLVSLLGTQQAVKALWARLIKGELATMSEEALGGVRFCVLAPEGPRSWRFATASLPGAAGYHGVLAPESARFGSDRADFLLFPRTPEEAPELHFRFLNRRVDLPLHRSWATWLWERALRVGEAVPLEARGIGACRCAPNAEALAADVSAAVRRRELRLEEHPMEVIVDGAS